MQCVTIIIHVGVQRTLGAHFGQGFGPIVLNYVTCNPNEATLSECYTSVVTYDCNHGKDAGVSCQIDPRLKKINSVPE